MGEVKVVSTCTSMFGMRVLIALEEKGVRYEFVEEKDLRHKSDLLLQTNPIHKKVPVLIHDGRPLCESSIIVEYIDEVWGSTDRPPFLPKDPYDRAVARFWVDYVDKKFYDAISRIVWQREGEIQEQGKSDLIGVIATLEKALEEVSDGKAFYGGDKFGYVDIAVTPFICWFRIVEEVGNFQVMDEKRWPRLWAWMKEVQEVESVKKVLQPPQKIVDYVLKLRSSIL